MIADIRPRLGWAAENRPCQAIDGGLVWPMILALLIEPATVVSGALGLPAAIGCSAPRYNRSSMSNWILRSLGLTVLLLGGVWPALAQAPNPKLQAL